MSLAITEVKKITQLAAIAVEPGELGPLGDKLSSILDLFAALSEADTDNIEPMAHPLDQLQRLREDAVLEVNQREKFQQIAPAVEDGLYLVPKVIE